MNSIKNDSWKCCDDQLTGNHQELCSFSKYEFTIISICTVLDGLARTHRYMYRDTWLQILIGGLTMEIWLLCLYYLGLSFFDVFIIAYLFNVYIHCSKIFTGYKYLFNQCFTALMHLQWKMQQLFHEFYVYSIYTDLCVSRIANYSQTL